MQSSDITQIFVALITTVGAIICARIGKKEESENNSQDSSSKGLNKWILGMYVCIGLLATNLGLLGWRMLAPESATEVKMNYPVDGTLVDQTETINGSCQNVPSSSLVWVVVFVPEVGRYYPQNNAADVLVDGRWSSLAYFGQDKDVGLKFDVIVVLAEKNAQAEFEAYLKTARDKVDYLGLAHLPQGTIIYDRATVTRK